MPDFPVGPIPLDPPIRQLVGDDLADRWPALASLGEQIGSAVTLQRIPGHADGFYEIKTKRIAIDERLPGNARISTAIHELAHALVRADRQQGDPVLDYAQEEIVSETVAYSVCSGLGFDTSGQSVPYVASYAQTEGAKAIQRYAALIDRLAKRIEDAIAPALEHAAPAPASVTDPEHDTQTPLKVCA